MSDVPASPEPVAYTVRVADDPADRALCFAVRKEVFVVEQGVPEDLEYDAYDEVAVHVLAVRDDDVERVRGATLKQTDENLAACIAA